MEARKDQPGGATTPQELSTQPASQADVGGGQGASEGASERPNLAARLRDWSREMRLSAEIARECGGGKQMVDGNLELSALLGRAAKAIDRHDGEKLTARIAAMDECEAIARRAGGNVYVAIKRINDLIAAERAKEAGNG